MWRLLSNATFSPSINLTLTITAFATAAVFTPQSGTELQAAVDACIESSPDANCTDDANEPIASCDASSETCLVSELPPKVQQKILEKQLAAKARKQQLKLQKTKFTTPSSTELYPSSITMKQYCSACPAGTFYHPTFTAYEPYVDILLSLERNNEVVATCEDGRKLTMTDFNYFIFAGTDAQIWSPRFYAKLAFEGFFTTTSKHRGPSPIMAPELQPFYRCVRIACEQIPCSHACDAIFAQFGCMFLIIHMNG